MAELELLLANVKKTAKLAFLAPERESRAKRATAAVFEALEANAPMRRIAKETTAGRRWAYELLRRPLRRSRRTPVL